MKFVSRAFKERAATLGLNTVAVPVRGKPLLSDRIRESFPEPWLGTVFPDLLGKAEGKILHRVDGVLYMSNSASTVWPYLLTASVLYETAHEAVYHMIEAKQQFLGRPTQRRAANRAIDSEKLREKYIECKGSHALIADGLGLPQQAAVSQLREVGLPNLINVRSDAKDPKAALEAFFIYENSFEESAKIGGLTSSQMAALIRCSGVKLKATLVSMNGHKSSRGIGALRTKRLMPQDARRLIENCQELAISSLSRVDIDSMESLVDSHGIKPRKIPVYRLDKFVKQGEAEMV